MSMISRWSIASSEDYTKTPPPLILTLELTTFALSGTLTFDFSGPLQTLFITHTFFLFTRFFSLFLDAGYFSITPLTSSGLCAISYSSDKGEYPRRLVTRCFLKNFFLIFFVTVVQVDGEDRTRTRGDETAGSGREDARTGDDDTRTGEDDTRTGGDGTRGDETAGSIGHSSSIWRSAWNSFRMGTSGTRRRASR